jgi:hypothetical protein
VENSSKEMMLEANIDTKKGYCSNKCERKMSLIPYLPQKPQYVKSELEE